MATEKQLKYWKSLKGKSKPPISMITRKKLALSKMGAKNPAYGKPSHNRGKHLSEETKNKLRIANKNNKPNLGRKFDSVWLKNLSNARKGKKATDETKDKMSLAQKGKKHGHWKISLEKCKNMFRGKGKDCPAWKGGITPENIVIRTSKEYKLWQYDVINKNLNPCQKCGENKLYLLVAHHIQNFAQYPELRFARENGITFCRPCHKEFHHIYGKKNNNIKQVKEFINNKSEMDKLKIIKKPKEELPVEKIII